MPLASTERREKFLGILNHRERWGLSPRGYLVILIALVAAAGLFLLGAYKFFGVTEPVDARLLVVEGWVEPYAVEVAVREFRSKSYELVFATGGPVRGTGTYTNDFKTTAGVGTDRLLAAGMPAHLVQSVPARANNRDRTYSSAVALRRWCEENRVALTSINVVTEGVHARRTRLLFRKAFGNGVKVGIIAVPNPDYDASEWWRYSEGVRAVLGECIAYAYARLFFHPGDR